MADDPRKAAANIIMKAEKTGVLPVHKLYKPNPLADQIGMDYEVDEEGVINYLPYERKEKEVVPENPQFLSREEWLESQPPPPSTVGYEVDEEDNITLFDASSSSFLSPPKKTDLILDPSAADEEGNVIKLPSPPKDTDILEDLSIEEGAAIVKRRLELPEGIGGWDPKIATPNNPKGAYGDNDWWIMHGKPQDTDNIGDGSWWDGPTGPYAHLHTPVEYPDLIDPLQDLKQAFDNYFNKEKE